MPKSLALQGGYQQQGATASRLDGRNSQHSLEAGTLRSLRLREMLLPNWGMQGGSLMSWLEAGQALVSRGWGVN